MPGCGSYNISCFTISNFFISVPFEIAPNRTPVMQLETSLVILTTALVISVAKDIHVGMPGCGSYDNNNNNNNNNNIR